jgi:glucosylglycerate synthase
MSEPWAVVLPSRDEAATIQAVAEVADQAIADHTALLVHVDHSRDWTTEAAFARAQVRAARRSLRTPRAGKGRQVLRGLADLPLDRSALVIDTDTRNPRPERYRALMAAVTDGADLAVADYRRHWFEANLTNHIARPLIAATLGLDLPQPLAGDIALSARAVRVVRGHYETGLDSALRPYVDGYGIDAFLVLASSAASLDIRSVPLSGRKEHAPSFPHLSQIFHDAVPVLLAMTRRTARCRGASALPVYYLAPTALPDHARQRMLDRLQLWRAETDSESPAKAWPDALVQAWRTVRAGESPAAASARLWPAYLERVRDYLTLGSRSGTSAACVTLTAAALDLDSQLAICHPSPLSITCVSNGPYSKVVLCIRRNTPFSVSNRFPWCAQETILRHSSVLRFVSTRFRTTTLWSSLPRLCPSRKGGTSSSMALHLHPKLNT